MSLDRIFYLIKVNDVEAAYTEAKDFFKVKVNKEAQALKVLIKLNELIHPTLEKKSHLKTSPSVIFALSDLCCLCISETWECTHVSFMQSLYHINRYLLSQGHLMGYKRLCQYYFKLRVGRKKQSWDSSEKVVITNTLYNLASFMCKTDSNFCQQMCNDDENSVFVWWQFLMDLVELNNYENLCLHFTVTSSFLVGTRSLLGVSEHAEISSKILSCYKQWSEKLSARTIRLKLNVKDMSSLTTNLLETFLNSTTDDEIIKYKCQPILSFLENLSFVLNGSTDIYESIHFLIKLFRLCESLSTGGLLESFNKFSETIENYGRQKKPIHCETITFSLHLIYKLRSCFVKNAEFVATSLVDFAKIVLNCLSHVKASKLPVKRKLTGQVNSLFFVMYLAFSVQQNATKVLADIFKEMKQVFKAFVSIPNIVDVNGLLCFGFTGCINVLFAYNKADLHCQSATLGIYLMKYLLKIETSHLITSPMKTYVTYSVNAFIQPLGKIGHEETAQIGLMALVGVHQELSEIVFTAWANLKVNNTNTSFNMESTVYDVIQNNAEVLESEWSPCKVESFQIDDLLLKEIRSYTKHKSLHGDPTLAVYRTAAKVCTKKLLLAEILLCATDVVTVQPDHPNINRFEMSLANIIQHLNKRCQENSDPAEKLHVLLLLGNIHYQKARCEIMHLRKKSEAEVVQLDLKPKHVVPVLEANEGDILNESLVAPAFSYLTLDSQAIIMDLLGKALNYWKKTYEILKPATGNEYFQFSLSYVKATGYLYRLYCHKVKEVETWELLYELSDKLNSSKHKVHAVAELLSIQFNVRDDWIESAILCIKNEEIDKKSYVTQLFIVSRAKNAYNNKKLEESKEILNTLDINQVKMNCLVYVQHQILSSLITGSKKTESSDKPLSYITPEACPLPAVKAFGNLLYIVNISKWNTFSQLCVVHCLLLDTSLLLGKLYADMKNVRHARCYTKQQLTLAQRLALPIRVTDLLILLARLDILCADALDCDVKLRGVETILELENCSDELCYQDGTEDGSASPTFRNLVKLKPKFVSHNSSCSCYHCCNIDYQILSLQAITLRADLLVTKGLSPQAKQVFKAGKNLIKVINSKVQTACGNVITTVFEAEIRFYIAAVTALGKWDSFRKAMDYYTVAKSRLTEMPIPDLILNNSLYYLETCMDWIQNYSLHVPKRRRDLTPIGKKIVVVDAVTPSNFGTTAAKPVAIGKAALKTNHLAIPVSPVPVPFRRRLILEDVSNSDDNSPVKETSEATDNPKGPKMPTVIVTRIGDDKANPPGSVSVSRETRKAAAPNETGPEDMYFGRKDLLKKLSHTEKKVRKTRGIAETGTPSNLVSFKPTRTAIKIYCDDIDDDATPATVRRGRPRRKPEACKDERLNSRLKLGKKLIFDETEEQTSKRADGKQYSACESAKGEKSNHENSSIGLIVEKGERRESKKDESLFEDSPKKPSKVYSPEGVATTARRGRPRRKIETDAEISKTCMKNGRKLIFDDGEEILGTARKVTRESSKANNAKPPSDVGSKVTRKLTFDDGDADSVQELEKLNSNRNGAIDRVEKGMKTALEEDETDENNFTGDDEVSPKQSTIIIDSDMSIIENTPPEKVGGSRSLKIAPLTPSNLLKDFKMLTISNRDKHNADSKTAKEVRTRTTTKLRTRTVINK